MSATVINLEVDTEGLLKIGLLVEDLLRIPQVSTLLELDDTVQIGRSAILVNADDLWKCCELEFLDSILYRVKSGLVR